MRARLAPAVVAVAALIPVVTVPAAAQASLAEWEPNGSAAPFARISYYMDETIEGRPGNWHLIHLDVEGDDDWVTGELVDYQCAPGEVPQWPIDACDMLTDAVFEANGSAVEVTWSPRLRRMHVVGDIELTGNDGQTTDSRVDMWLHATGPYSRSTTRTWYEGSDPYQEKIIEKERPSVTASGTLGWLTASDPDILRATPLHVTRKYLRGYLDGQ